MTVPARLLQANDMVVNVRVTTPTIPGGDNSDIPMTGPDLNQFAEKKLAGRSPLRLVMFCYLRTVRS